LTELPLISLSGSLSYKPDIFSACGVYRGNEWGLRPTLYTSRFDIKDGKSKVECNIDPNWRFVVTSPEVNLESHPVEQEKDLKDRSNGQDVQRGDQ
jgi:hypothetical protein